MTTDKSKTFMAKLQSFTLNVFYKNMQKKKQGSQHHCNIQKQT